MNNEQNKFKDSSECFSSDTSPFYDEEAALRKYVRLKQKHLDQDLRHVS